MEASAIFATMEQNEAALARKWKGACVQVHGFVGDVSEGPLGGIHVTVTDGGKFNMLNRIRCEPKDAKTATKALDLVVGQEIVVKGVGGREVMKSLGLEQCDW